MTPEQVSSQFEQNARDHMLIKDTLTGLASSVEHIRRSVDAFAEMARKTDIDLKFWVRTVQIAASVFVLLGSLVLAIFGWILIDKNADMRAMQGAMLTNQVAIERVSSTQQSVLQEIKALRESDKQIMSELLAGIKEHREFYRDSRKGQ